MPKLLVGILIFLLPVLAFGQSSACVIDDTSQRPSSKSGRISLRSL